MNKYFDKIIVFLLCAVTYLQFQTDIYVAVPIICVVIISALMSYIDKRLFVACLFIVFCVAAVFYPILLFFLPLIFYDVFLSKVKYLAFLGVVPVIANFRIYPVHYSIIVILFAVLSYLMKIRTVSLEELQSEYIALRDTTTEFSLQLENKNNELMEKQDYEINLATLNERNRIARDIHDSIGHLLSNSILQTGAMLTICKDEKMRSMLQSLKDTLTEGMNSVRSSIHGLYDDSVDLYTETRTIISNFKFCEVAFDFDMNSNPDMKIKYAMMYIIKEALSNVIKHSNATMVKITLKEHPALYQLIIKDNGAKMEFIEDGIGIKNMKQRVESLGGIANITYANGFTVFISIPKEGVL